jgi:cellobiose-specific phosphotransferase system component IIC
MKRARKDWNFVLLFYFAKVVLWFLGIHVIVKTNVPMIIAGNSRAAKSFVESRYRDKLLNDM